jgi:D-cysteine desulfhydrase
MALLVRYPALERIPRISLRRNANATPVERADAIHANLWIKRDDLCADPLGGNKVRALEFLLGPVCAGDRVVTVGSAGSTHALAVATYGAIIGARVFVGRWRQEMNAAAERVSRVVSERAVRAPVFRSVVGAYLWAWTQRLRGARWIAAGGSTPLGILGHVNAGLEVVDQIDRGELPEPRYVVTPLGTGGTMAGLALAFAIAGREITVVGARVVPRIVARLSHVRSLAHATASLIERNTGFAVPRIHDRLVVEHTTYGGAYGRETDAGRAAARRLRAAMPIALDATYSAKAFAHAADLASRGTTLFWLTFDSRSLDIAS